ncbi:hypothetical protein LAD74_02850 [Mycoplasma sp. U97]|uniref:LppA-related lipoprotein n=1 Tax=Mycoplasma tauri TaxID=547987 RepID=UPI001CBBC1A0|nr:hypothetical protein [Mycoplasma tauri]MBZ4212907.1 hypothetical protein [Mycoplasma tauri]
MKKLRFLLPTLYPFPLFSVSCVQQQAKNNSEDKKNDVINKENNDSIRDTSKEKGTIKTGNSAEEKESAQQERNNEQSQSIDNQEQSSSQNSDSNLFNDLNSIEKNITISIPFYKNKDAESSWAVLKNNINELIPLLGLNQDIKLKYSIEYTNDNNPNVDNNAGKIKNIGVKFSHNNQSQVLYFNLNGFYLQNNNLPKNNKNDYLKAKVDLPMSVKGLYPSLIAHMLLYAEDPNKYNQKQVNSSGKYLINFEQLQNKNTDLFYEQVASLNISLKEAFFEYNENFNNKYMTKVVATKFNDIEGTLGIKIQITNTEDGPRNEPELTIKFEFNGLRKIDLNNGNNNVIGFNILPTDLVNLINKKDPIKKVIKDNYNSLNQPIDLISNLDDFNYKSLINELNKIMNVSILDNELNTYRFTKGSEKISSFEGLQQKFGLYPFYTRFNDVIKNVRLEIMQEDENKNAQIYFDVELPIFMQSSYTDLSDNEATGKSITINVKSKFNLNKINNIT